MNKAKVLSAALAAAMLASVVAVSASAYSTEGKTYGVCGIFTNNWTEDIEMTGSGGVYTAEVTIDNVTEDMITELTSDGTPTGKTGIQFKVRGVGDWTDSWGQYEEDQDRTYNSQTNCCIEGAEVGKPLKFKVTFDTTKMDANKIAEGGEVDPADEYLFWGVTYEVVETQAEEPAEPAGTEEPTDTEEPAETPAAETETETETTPATGDATSAAALVGVVLASLGVAAVMTKKASSKE